MKKPFKKGKTPKLKTKRTEILSHPTAPSSSKLRASYRVLCDGIDSVNSLWTLYGEAMTKRGGGAPTHEEQDLLRAMLVMAGATLDATLKAIVNDGLGIILQANPASLSTCKVIIERELSRNNYSLLAETLLSDVPRERLVEHLKEELTGRSLQSTEELMRTANALGVGEFWVSDPLKKSFAARNQIVHEMDALSGAGRRRRSRRRNEMREFAKVLLESAITVIQNADKSINSTESKE